MPGQRHAVQPDGRRRRLALWPASVRVPHLRGVLVRPARVRTGRDAKLAALAVKAATPPSTPRPADQASRANVSYAGFSLSSLYLATRLVGRCEIVVPETRPLLLPPRLVRQQGEPSADLGAHLCSSRDVLLLRFTLTQPCPSTRLEARLQFFYPAVLLRGPDAQPLDAVTIYNSAIFLGGTEERSPPHVRCPMASSLTLARCDVASFIPNPAPIARPASKIKLPGTGPAQPQNPNQKPPDPAASTGHLPVAWEVRDGWEAVCGRWVRPAALPLCLRNSTHPGRWIGGDAAPPYCPGVGGKVGSNETVGATAGAAGIGAGTGEGLGRLASGDPCILHSLHAQYNRNEPAAEDAGSQTGTSAPTPAATTSSPRPRRLSACSVGQSRTCTFWATACRATSFLLCRRSSACPA